MHAGFGSAFEGAGAMALRSPPARRSVRAACLRLLLIASTVAASPMAAGPFAATAGVVVEKVTPGGGAEAAGIVVGDVLLSWRRSSGLPAGRPVAGEIDTPLDLWEPREVQASLGPVTLSVQRGETLVEIVLPAGRSWGVSTRPRISEGDLDSYHQVVQRFEAGADAEGIEAIRALAVKAELAGEPELGVWFLYAATLRLAGVSKWEEILGLYADAERLASDDPTLTATLRQSAGGLLYYHRRDKEAERFYRGALEGGQGVSSSEDIVTAYLHYLLGGVAEFRSDLTSAEERYRAALEIQNRLSPGSLAVAATLERLGRVADQRGDAASAEEHLKRCLEIRERILPDSLEVASTLHNLGGAAWLRRDAEAATAYLTRALALRERLVPSSLDIAATLSSLCAAVWLRRDIEKATEYCGRALEIAERVAPGSRVVATALDNLGGLTSDGGDLLAAESYHRRALEIHERLFPESVRLAQSISNLGRVTQERGDLASAEALHRRALELRERNAPGSLVVAESLEHLGALAAQRGDLDRAEDHLRRSVGIREGLAPESLDVAQSLTTLGEILRARGELESAESLHRRAAGIQERVAPESHDHASSLYNLAVDLQARGQQAQAEAQHRRSLEIRERLGPGGLPVARSLGALGDLASERGEFQAALDLHGRALGIRERLAPGSILEAESAAALARIHRRAGDRAGSLARFQQAVAALEAQHGKLGGVDEERTAFRSRNMGIYRELIDVLVEQDRAAEALHALERSRARGLLALLAERDLILAADLPEELDRERRMVAADYDRTQDALGKLSPERDADSVQESLATLQTLRRKRAEIQEEIRRRSPRAAGLQDPEPLDLAGVRRAMDPGTVLLSYSVGEVETHLFVVDSRGELKSHVLAVGEPALRAEVEALRRSIEGSRAGGAQAAEMIERGQGLYRTLVSPALAALEAGERILVIPDGPLHQLPFASLVRPGGADSRGRRYLVEWKPIHVAVSVTVYAELKRPVRDRGDHGPHKLLAFGDPSYAGARGGKERHDLDPVLRSVLSRFDALPPLPATREEVQGIASLYGDGATILLGAEATEARAKAAGTQPGPIHFAAHGIVDERFPLDSAIVLSIPERIQAGEDNGLLQAWEILERVRLDTDLVTLSACETALGAEMAGEGLIGLTRAFQYAGARSVLASLWKVADQSTAELMKRFYTHLRSGRTKDEALRAAQMEMIQGRIGPGAQADPGERGVGKLSRSSEAPSAADYASPFYWAAFELFGDWR